jgi:ubiquitin-protein ligase E3 C
VFINVYGAEESGIDIGGLFKELWTELSSKAFDPNFGLFKVTGDQMIYPSPSARMVHGPDNMKLFEFVGKVVGKALFEGIVVEPKFAHFFLSKLLGNFNQLNDLPSLDMELYKNLMFLKTYDGDAADLALNMTVVENALGESKEVELVPGGSRVDVTNDNKLRYVHLVANYHLNVQLKEASAAFCSGMHSVIDFLPKEYIKMFSEPELQVLLSGTQKPLDVNDLKEHTRYTGGYHSRDKHVSRFWKVVGGLDQKDQALLLRFVTSCQRSPLLGWKTLQPKFCLHR